MTQVTVNPQPPAQLPAHERLIEAAKDLFASEGYENATTAAIARQAGTSESQLVKHFGSKGGLLQAIFDEAWGGIEAGVAQAMAELPSPLRKLQALAQIVASAFESDRRLRSLLLLEGRRIRKKGHDVVMSAGFRRFVQLLDEVFKEMQERGQLRSDIDLQAVRSAYMGAFEGLMRDRLLAELIDYPARYGNEEAVRTAGLVLSGFLTPETRKALRQVDG